MHTDRRGFLRALLGLAAGGLASRVAGAQAAGAQAGQPARQAEPEAGPVPARGVITPDLPKLPWHWEGGAKAFHLNAEPVRREFMPGWRFDAWGFNGCVPGPTIEVNEGDRVRITVENRLPEATGIHWHGIELPIGMDGVPGLTQPPIMPGESYTYEFTLHQQGTHFYHSHMAMQEMMGMLGLFIIHPRRALHPVVDKDFGLVLQEWAILPQSTIPNSMSMEFNWLTINGRVGPATTPLIVRQGERVRLRFVNLGMDHHPMHLHGYQFYMTGTEGGRVPESAWYPQNTVLVGVGQARDVEFEAVYPGDWMLHCHLPHHMANHMASMVGPIVESMAEMGRGMPAGLSMEEGMGMMRQGQALAPEHGPSLGKATGLKAQETLTSNMVGPREEAGHAEHGGMAMPGDIAPMPRARLVPGFPQDMSMADDAAFAKPQTYGLRRGWSGAVMGMMTLVRVLPQAEYDHVMRLIRGSASGG